MVELNIMSMNLRKETEEDGKNNWPERIGLVVRLINEVTPHLFGTQEGRRPQVYGLLDALEGYGIADSPQALGPPALLSLHFLSPRRTGDPR